MSAVKYQVLQEILRILKEDLDLSIDELDDGTATAIPPENIHFRKISGERDLDQGRAAENFPMALVSMPFKEPFPEDAGTNQEDEYRWRFLIQFIDSDNLEPQANLATYLKWQENTSLRFQFNNMTHSGNVIASRCLSTAAAVDVVDERYWLKEENFKGGVELLIRTWLMRTSDC